MRMHIAELSLRMLLLLPVSFVSAAAVSNFMPRAGAVKVTEECSAHMNAGKHDYAALSSEDSSVA